MDYLPEWKIYLWKKLLLDKRSIDDAPKINDFIFFDDEDQYAIPLRLAQNEIDRIEVIKQGNGTFTDIGEGTAIDDSYYSFGPKKILSALLELVNDKAKILEIFNISISPLYLIQYRKKRAEYLAKERRLRVASISSGGRGISKPDQHYFNDTLCGVGDVFSKIRDSQELSLDDLKILTYCKIDFLWDYLSFKIKIDKISLTKKLHEYINYFMLGELIPPPKVRYFSNRQQQEKIFSSIELFEKKYGRKNISVTFQELAEMGGWYHEQSHFRFYETIFSLETAGKIEIQDLRKEEVVISLELPEQTLSEADKKKLFVLEKIKDRWDLVSKKDNAMVRGALIHMSPGGQDDIPQRTFSSWMNECGLDDYSQFKNIMAGFQDEGLIISFEFLSEYK